jgi:hypothetical protein
MKPSGAARMCGVSGVRRRVCFALVREATTRDGAGTTVVRRETKAPLPPLVVGWLSAS